MEDKIKYKHSDTDYKEFIGYRQGLDPFNKKLEAAKLIEQTRKVDTGNAYRKVSKEINKGGKLIRFYSAITRIAAVLTLPLLIFTIWSLFFNLDFNSRGDIAENDIVWQEIQSPAGTRSYVILPDGTNLWLNAESYLRYGIPFTRDRREVELSGEAFLNVTNDGRSPFVVKAGDTEVEVLGTQFNVSAWPENEQIQVALKEGEVHFHFLSKDGTAKFVELKPNDLLEYNKTNKTAMSINTDIEKFIAWHQNVIILDDTSMTDLAKLLEKWYGVKVVIASEEVKRYRFTTTFDNEPLHRVLELLEISSPGIKFEYSMGKPIEGSKRFSPPVVTITKI